MPIWFFYILKCSDTSLYTGITTDLEKRIRTHNEGKASKYTRSRLPVKLEHSERFRSESSARVRETEVKKLSRLDKLKLIGK